MAAWTGERGAFSNIQHIASNELLAFSAQEHAERALLLSTLGR